MYVDAVWVFRSPYSWLDDTSYKYSAQTISVVPPDPSSAALESLPIEGPPYRIHPNPKSQYPWLACLDQTSPAWFQNAAPSAWRPVSVVLRRLVKRILTIWEKLRSRNPIPTPTHRLMFFFHCCFPKVTILVAFPREHCLEFRKRRSECQRHRVLLVLAMAGAFCWILGTSMPEFLGSQNRRQLVVRHHHLRR